MPKSCLKIPKELLCRKNFSVFGLLNVICGFPHRAYASRDDEINPCKNLNPNRLNLTRSLLL
jgi:hypothetical protein